LVGSGNDRAFSLLYERYHQPLYRYCRSMLRNEADAQDALQATFTAAFAALRRSQRDAPLRPWLFRIAHNESVSLLRRRRPEDELSAANEQAAPSAAELVEERQRLSLLIEDLRELPDRQRGALVMRELSGLSHEDIALALGSSVGGAKQTIFEARRALAEFAEGRAMSCEQVQRTISDADGRVLRARRVRAHLRECSGCAAFAAAIPERSVQMRALAPPLPAAAAAGLLARILGGGSGHSGGAGGIVAGAAGKTVGGMLTAKTVAGIAIVATATLGTTAVIKNVASTPAHPPADQAVSAASEAGSSSTGLARATRAVGATGRRSAAGAAHSAAGRAVALQAIARRGGGHPSSAGGKPGQVAGLPLVSPSGSSSSSTAPTSSATQSTPGDAGSPATGSSGSQGLHLGSSSSSAHSRGQGNANRGNGSTHSRSNSGAIHPPPPAPHNTTTTTTAATTTTVSNPSRCALHSQSGRCHGQ
jgi:RNA polymerase sigma factor (sigma-70 family)